MKNALCLVLLQMVFWSQSSIVWGLSPQSQVLSVAQVQSLPSALKTPALPLKTEMAYLVERPLPPQGLLLGLLKVIHFFVEKRVPISLGFGFFAAAVAGVVLAATSAASPWVILPIVLAVFVFTAFDVWIDWKVLADYTRWKNLKTVNQQEPHWNWFWTRLLKLMDFVIRHRVVFASVFSLLISSSAIINLFLHTSWWVALPASLSIVFVIAGLMFVFISLVPIYQNWRLEQDYPQFFVQSDLARLKSYQKLGLKAFIKPLDRRPHGVSSLTYQQGKKISAWPVKQEQAIERLVKILQSMPRSRIVFADSQKIVIQFRSKWLGFVDELRFFYDPSAGKIHLRSEAQSGYYDFAVNRKRMQTIQQAFVSDIPTDKFLPVARNIHLYLDRSDQSHSLNRSA